MVPIRQSDTSIEKESLDFVLAARDRIIKRYALNQEMVENSLSFRFPKHEEYGEEIQKIDPNETYTHDGRNRGYGKIICKDGKMFVIIDSLILTALARSGYKFVTSKHVIYHELGHCVNCMLYPELQPEDKPFGKVPLWDCSRYLCSVMVDEYMANNYITFLFSKEECAEILSTNTLYTDIENIYTNIFDPFDLFNRFWNSPKAIFKNLLEHIPFFQATGGFKETAVLEITDIKDIIAVLNKPNPQFDIIHYKLVGIFNIIVADYNSDNLPVLQELIR